MGQIQSAAVNFLIILVGAPLAGAYFSWQTGELHSWADLPTALLHGTFAGFMMAIGWLLMRSPWAGKITELLTTKTSPSGVKETTAVKIIEPPPMAEKPDEGSHK